MIVGIGCDLIEIARVRVLLERFGKRMQQRMLSEAEQAKALEKPDPVLRMAKYIAAKEAAYKALPSQYQQGFGWLDAQICYHEGGKPRLVYSEKISRELPPSARVHVSISDSESHAMAYVIIEQTD